MGRVVCLHTQRNGRHFRRVKYSLKLGKASLHRYHVGQKVCRIHSIWYGFRDTSIFVFCNFCKKLENSKWPPFLVGQKFLKIGSATQKSYPTHQNFHRNRTVSHGFRDTRIFVFCIFEKNSKIQNDCHFWQAKYSLKLRKASFHRYPVGQKFCRNLTSKFLFYEENGIKKYSYISIVPSYEPIFPILCFAFFVKNLKIEYDPHFWEKIF